MLPEAVCHHWNRRAPKVRKVEDTTAV